MSSKPDPTPFRIAESFPGITPQQHRLVILGLTILPLLGFIAAIIFAWEKEAVVTGLIMLGAFYVITMLGVTIGYHRLFTHRSFNAKPALKIGLAIAGSLALQGSIITWVANHRRHHAFSDRPGDPHSPHLAVDEGWKGWLKGFWHAHVGWLFRGEKTSVQQYASDLLNDKILARIDRHYPLWILLTLFLPLLLGLAIEQSWRGAFIVFLWGSLARVFLLHHVTWSINSVCHVFGKRPFQTKDESRNQWVMGLLALGEGWHNNHHAFPSAAIQGLHWWQMDVSGMMITLFEKLGWAEHVKRVSPQQLKARKAEEKSAQA